MRVCSVSDSVSVRVGVATNVGVCVGITVAVSFGVIDSESDSEMVDDRLVVRDTLLDGSWEGVAEQEADGRQPDKLTVREVETLPLSCDTVNDGVCDAVAALLTESPVLDQDNDSECVAEIVPVAVLERSRVTELRLVDHDTETDCV